MPQRTMFANSQYDDALAGCLAGLLPEAAFDAHAHVYRVADTGPQPSPFLSEGPPVAGVDLWRDSVGRHLGGDRLQGGLLMPFPTRDGDVDAGNAFLLAELDRDTHCVGSVLVTPGMSPEAIAPCLAHPRVVGFKPYHCFAAAEPTFDAPLSAFLPEWAWELAHDRGLCITVHLVRNGALADPDNQAEIVSMCRRYPGANMILAHAARGFHAPNTVSAVPALRGLENVWFDTSAICESAPIIAILKDFGPRRLMWGSDFPVSHQRGRAVTMGDGFAWIDPGHVEGASPACHPAAVGLEALRALREAADLFGLNEADLRDVFHDNAMRLLGTAKEPGTRTQELYTHAKQRIPGGTQLLSKRPEMFAPDQWPAYFREARGCEVWDLDGRHYYDMCTNGISTCLLGFGAPEVTQAVLRRIRLGSMCTQNPPEEVELADRLTEIHPWADQVRYTRCGGEACAVAARIARATTNRSRVAICGYHGWYDWYLAANLGSDDALMGHLLPGLDALGVPSELRGTALTFPYNDRDAFQAILEAHGDSLAAVVMEPMRYHEPEEGFLEFVRDGAHRHGALLVYDEVTIGWRLCFGGAHLRLGVEPDLAIFAKALGNGHPVGAVIGTRDAMDGAHGSFISSTYWTESVGPTAALATLAAMGRTDVPGHVARVGRMVQAAWRDSAQAHGLPVSVDPGEPALAHFAFNHDDAQALTTLYTQLMLGRGFLARPAISPTMAHTDEIVGLYAAAIEEVFSEMAAVVAAGRIRESLKGPVAHTGFSRLL
jgi:glutamate-1-semialdehyde 2,1-aminomutase